MSENLERNKLDSIKTKMVIDGHSGGAFTEAAVGSMVCGLIIGILVSSSIFQLPVCGYIMPKCFWKAK